MYHQSRVTYRVYIYEARRFWMTVRELGLLIPFISPHPPLRSSAVVLNVLTPFSQYVGGLLLEVRHSVAVRLLIAANARARVQLVWELWQPRSVSRGDARQQASLKLTTSDCQMSDLRVTCSTYGVS